MLIDKVVYIATIIAWFERMKTKELAVRRAPTSGRAKSISGTAASSVAVARSGVMMLAKASSKALMLDSLWRVSVRNIEFFIESQRPVKGAVRDMSGTLRTIVADASSVDVIESHQEAMLQLRRAFIRFVIASVVYPVVSLYLLFTLMFTTTEVLNAIPQALTIVLCALFFTKDLLVLISNYRVTKRLSRKVEDVT